MKRKIFAVISVILLMTNLTACSGKTPVSEIREQTQEPQTTDYVEESNSTPIIAYLNKQVETEDYDSMEEVAECEQATEAHLLRVAEYCIKGNYKYIAQKVADNKNCTISVIMKFTESRNPDILSICHGWLHQMQKLDSTDINYCLDKQIETENYYAMQEVAECEQATEAHLIRVAEYCVKERYIRCIAQKVIENKNCTDLVIEKLATSNDYYMLKMIACSDKVTEQALVEIAKYCIEQNWDGLAQEVIENKNCTDLVIEELATSNDYDMLEMIACSDKATEQALVEIAKYCIEQNLDGLAQKVADNNSCTISVAMMFTESSDADVISVGHQWAESH